MSKIFIETLDSNSHKIAINARKIQNISKYPEIKGRSIIVFNGEDDYLIINEDYNTIINKLNLIGML